MLKPPPENLISLLAVLQIIEQRDGTDCTGTCHHRQPGEFHCHSLAQMIGLSSTGVQVRIRELLRLGFLARRRIKRESGTMLTRFVITDKGRSVLSKFGSLIEGVDKPDASSHK
jgi:hypothetical protein